jgi:hypothetical protein
MEWLENVKGRDHSEDLGVNGKIILNWISGERVGGCGLDSPGLGYGSVAGSCEYGNKPLGSIKSWGFLD